MSINIRRPEEIKKIAAASRAVAKTLDYLTEQVKPNISTKELNSLAENFIKNLGGRAAFKGLYGFPDGVCISVNEVIIHGIPSNYKLKEGDIVGLDIGVEIDGWYGDAAKTVGVGKISKDDTDLINCSYEALMHAIDIVREGMHFKEISYEIEKYIISKGFVPLKGYCGHGIGKRPHEDPEILNYLEGTNPKQGPKIKEGMVFCIEPMICCKSGKPKVLSDNWAVVSEDGLRGSHWEHTIAIVNKKAKILSIDDTEE
ncbi:MAG: type I methionyl aminopeptidase [Campylobacteraceae bacterium]|jgi:methionyl aminopeptidase|nr:type I methionyl aminopeptidase [Campylobacteraceae bacterium]